MCVATERRIKVAKYPVLKSLETFEFRAIPSLNKSLVLELARSEYLDRRENVLALGNSGTGKTHLALALGLAACQKGYRVRFTTAAALVNELLEARDDKRLLRVQKQLVKQDLLIVDELGYVPLSKTRCQGVLGIYVSYLAIAAATLRCTPCRGERRAARPWGKNPTAASSPGPLAGGASRPSRRALDLSLRP